MAWIELHQTLPTNKKTMRLSIILNIDAVQAVGHLCFLWLWAIDNAPDGRLNDFYNSEIAFVAGWKGDPDEFVNSLIKSGFVDENKSFHDWYDYAGKLIEKRKEDAERKRTAREKLEEVRNKSSGHPADIQRTSKENPCDGAGNRTVPYRTVPYRTVPNQSYHGGVVEDSVNPDGKLNEPVENYEDGVKTEFIRAWGRLPTQQEATKAIGLIVNLCGEVTDDGIEILGNALDSCTDHNAKTISYLSGIFKNLKERGIKTADDYYGYDIERSRRKKKSG